MKRGDAGMENKTWQQHFLTSAAGYLIAADARLLNRDLSVSLSGGDVPHIGGVLTYDRQADQVQEVRFASHDGRHHKDILLARRFFTLVKPTLPGNACFSAGVHLNGISPRQIQASFTMVDCLARQVQQWLRSHRDFKQPQYTSHLNDSSSRKHNERRL